MITPEQREEVINWLYVHGINPDQCARFHVDGWEVECEMFELDIDGKHVLNTRGDVKYTESKTFTSTWWPEGVESELPKM